MIYICHQRPPFLVTIRLEQLYCNKKGAFFGITFDAHPHSGWFICLERFAFSTEAYSPIRKSCTVNAQQLVVNILVLFIYSSSRFFVIEDTTFGNVSISFRSASELNNDMKRSTNISISLRYSLHQNANRMF